MSAVDALGEARARFELLAARDGPEISAAGRSRFYATRERTALGVVLLHGLTNAPEQWARFASELSERGINSIVPRFPGHGHVDRQTKVIGRVRASELMETAGAGVAVAAAAAERVVVVGLSIGAPLAAALALANPQIARIVCIAPLFGLAHLSRRQNALITKTLEIVPNLFLPWDPRGGTAQIPPYAYARFPTRVLAECLRVALDVQKRARDGIAPHGDVRFLLNAHEPACNNDLASETSRNWNAVRPGSSIVETAYDFPPVHDVVDPNNEEARTDIVYPRIHALIAS